MGKISDGIRVIDSDICSQEVLIKAFDSRKKALLENHIVTLQDEISHTAGSVNGVKKLTRHKIKEYVGTAAGVLCSLSSGQCFRDDVVDIVALLGTVADRKISRMLSMYLGEDNMLAVVCKTLDAANYFEKYDADGSVDVHFGIHQEAANLGAPIRKRFPIICLDSIRPYTGDLHLHTKQKLLALPFPHSKGFKGFAVNMISLSPENLKIITKDGYGLRETLFYRLFGELQVYETCNDMWQAIPHLKNGAISLDGGIIKGDGMLILGYSDPEVTFPVVPRADDSEDVCTKIKTMHAEIEVIKTLENRIREAEEKRQKLVTKRIEKKRKFEEISEKLSDEIRKIDDEICSQEVLIKAFDSRKETYENHIINLQDEISHAAGSATGAKELTRHKIEENVGTAAAVLCTLSSGQCFRDDVVGIVALLGTVADRKMSRMLSVYLGEDNMLAVVCKTLAAANYFEKYAADGSVDVHFGIHQEAANLGAPIRKRFPVICLDAIRPYTGDLHLHTKQKPLALPFPQSKGFKEYAVNMIDLSPEGLKIHTKHGYGLRETLFYRLFGELEVYETRDDMWQAIPHLKNGAVSLDGWIIKGDGMLILGYSDPETSFPVVPRSALDVQEDNSEDVCTKIKTMHAQMEVVKTLENRIREAEEKRQKLVTKRSKKKRKFDEISVVMSQSSGSGDHQLY